MTLESALIKDPKHLWRRIKNRFIPPEIKTMEEYYSLRYPGMARAYKRFLRQCEIPEIPDDPTPVGVVVMPWIGTPSCWFAITVAIGLMQRGRKVTLIYDDTAFSLDRYIWEQNYAIREILAELPAHLPVLTLSNQPLADSHGEDASYLERAITSNLGWFLKGAPPNAKDIADGEKAKVDLQQTLGRIRGLFAQQNFKYLIFPGGVYGASGLYPLVAHEHNVRFVTYDAGLGVLFVCQNGVAAQLTDIPQSFARLWAADADTRSRAVRDAKAEFQKRLAGTDRQKFQVTPASLGGVKAGGDILIPLNIDWDSAALGRHHIFKNTSDWLVSTVGYILQNSSANIVVRQHPDERHAATRGDLDFAGLLSANYGQNPRLRFVGATEAVNTYELLEAAQVVLPFVSTIGSEAAALGKPVIPAGSCYYSTLGFVWSASSKEEYFRLIDEAIQGRLGLLPDQEERAWLCYYLTQICYRNWTTFTAQAPDFDKWAKLDPQKLLQSPEVARVLTAMDTGEPISWLAHQALQAKTDLPSKTL